MPKYVVYVNDRGSLLTGVYEALNIEEAALAALSTRSAKDLLQIRECKVIKVEDMTSLSVNVKTQVTLNNE